MAQRDLAGEAGEEVEADRRDSRDGREVHDGEPEVVDDERRRDVEGGETDERGPAADAAEERELVGVRGAEAVDPSQDRH